jgi:hypothetical protein
VVLEHRMASSEPALRAIIGELAALRNHLRGAAAPGAPVARVPPTAPAPRQVAPPGTGPEPVPPPRPVPPPQVRARPTRSSPRVSRRATAQVQDPDRPGPSTRRDEPFCTVCQFAVSEPSYTLECGHAFCIDCILAWSLSPSERCPNCNRNFNRASLATYRESLRE